MEGGRSASSWWPGEHVWYGVVGWEHIAAAAVASPTPAMEGDAPAEVLLGQDAEGVTAVAAAGVRIQHARVDAATSTQTHGRQK